MHLNLIHKEIIYIKIRKILNLIFCKYKILRKERWLMKIMNLNSVRETYSTQMKYSILFEMGLGIAAYTYYDFHHTLEKPTGYWEDIKNELTSTVQKELNYTHKYNTWFALLQLLHSHHFDSLQDLIEFLNQLPENKVRRCCLPYLGSQHEETRGKASHKKEESIASLMNSCKHHKFFPAYIEYISTVDIDVLKKHLKIIAECYRTKLYRVHSHVRTRRSTKTCPLFNLYIRRICEACDRN